MLCGRCPGDEVHYALDCAALHSLRDDIPALFQPVPILMSMRCTLWQEQHGAEDTMLWTR